MKIYLTDEHGFISDVTFFDKLASLILHHLNEKDSDDELSILITDDETIHQLNLNYRNKDSATDVLSFEMNDAGILGDIVISLETAKNKATEYDMSLTDEVAFLFIHGFLHLKGFDHERSVTDEKIMFDLQDKVYKDWKVNQ